MIHNLDADQLVKKLVTDLRISLQMLDLSKSLNIYDVFSTVRFKTLGDHQKIWESNCIKLLVSEGFLLFDESTDVISTSDKILDFIKDSDKIRQLVIEACDTIPENSVSNIENIINVDKPSDVIEFSPKNSSDILDQNTESNVDELSWDKVYEFFSKEDSAVLLHVRKRMGEFKIREKWTRIDFFPSTKILSEPRQRQFLANAVNDGVIEKEGERIHRKYWLNPNRTDHHSFRLIAGLIFPSKSLSHHIKQDFYENLTDESNYASKTDLDNLRQEFSNTLEQYLKIFENQSQKIKNLSIQIEQLSGKVDGQS